MPGFYGRHIFDSKPRIDRPAAKIHVLEPHRSERFIHAFEAFPHVAADYHKRAGRLLDRSGYLQIAIQATIASIHGIRRPQAIYPEQFEDERFCSRQITDRKPGLCPTLRVSQLTGGEPVGAAGVEQRFERVCERYIRIQNQDRIGIRDGARPLIHSCSESAVRGVPDTSDRFMELRSRCRVIGRRIIDDRYGNPRSMAPKSIQTIVDHRPRIIGHDYRGSSQK